MRELKLICSDMDGVIIDSMPQLEQMAVDLMVDHYNVGPDAARRDYRHTVGRPFLKQLDMIFPEYYGLNREVATVYAGRHEDLAPSLEPCVQARQAFQSLHEKGFKLALVSSTSATIIRNIVHLNVLPFDVIYGQNGSISKATQVGMAMVKFGVTNSQTLLLGDTDHDCEVAVRLGTHFHLTTCETLLEQTRNL